MVPALRWSVPALFAVALALAPAAHAQSAGLPVPTTSPAAVQPGQTVTCSAANAQSYAWHRDGAKVADGAGYAVTAADAPPAVLTCVAKVALGLGLGTLDVTSLPVVVVAAAGGDSPAAPVVLPPTIDGTPRSGETATCVEGTVVGAAPPYAYAWQRDGAQVATGKTYGLTDADVGRSITCTVTATNAAGSTTSLPSVVPLVPGAAGLPLPLNTVAPRITGVAEVGRTVTCERGTWVPDGAAFTFGWNVGGAAVAGATGSTYGVRSADAGRALTCTVTATNAVGAASKTSAPVTVAAAGSGGGGSGDGDGSGAAPPRNVAAPTLAGRAQAGRTLSCRRGSWNGTAIAFHYRWLRGGDLIKTAMERRYRLQDSDTDERIRCAVIAVNAAGYAAAASDPARVTPAALRVTRFKVAPRRFRLRQGRVTFRWRQSREAKARIRLYRKVAGQRRGSRCKPLRRGQRARPGRRCTRWKRVASLDRTAKQGTNRARFRGKVGRRWVAPGRYRAVITARDERGTTSKKRRRSFRVRPPRVKTGA